MQSNIARTDEEITSCFNVMVELRPHLTPESFVARVKRQMADGYRLAYLADAGKVVCCAGFRILENLAWGRFLYVDDLVTVKERQGAGFGSTMLQWLIEEAKRQGCAEFHLDSGTWRTEAHSFYFKHKMVIKSFHFSLPLKG